jgi:hypothetical protein
MNRGFFAASITGFVLAAVPLTAAVAQAWTPGSEIVGQSVQVETNGVVNTIYFDPGGVARIASPAGRIVPATWTAAGGQLCLQSASGSECWPYAQAFQAGSQVTLVSSCNATSRWMANSVNAQQSKGERG